MGKLYSPRGVFRDSSGSWLERWERLPMDERVDMVRIVPGAQVHGSEPAPVVEIYVEPRFKQSGLSGDMWRTNAVIRFRGDGPWSSDAHLRSGMMDAMSSVFAPLVGNSTDRAAMFSKSPAVCVEFWYKGVLMTAFRRASMLIAVAMLKWDWVEFTDHYSGSPERSEAEARACMQPGCLADADTVVRLKELSGPMTEGRIGVRQFCSRHARRGDCCLVDRDSSYVPVVSPKGGRKQLRPQTFRESMEPFLAARR